MSRGPSTERDRGLLLALTISRVAHPLAQVPFVLLVAGVRVAGVRGFWFGLLAAVFVAGLPGGLLGWATRAGRVVDMDVSRLEQRPLVLLLTLVSVLAGAGLLVVTGAPAPLRVLLASMAAGVLVAAVVSRFWKASIHTACATGTATVLAVFGPGWVAVATGVVAVLVAWARVRTGAHDVPQVVAGALIGVTIPWLTLTLLR